MISRPRIAIPVPHSGDPAYVERSLPQYERAVDRAGGEAVRIPLDAKPAETLALIESCDGVLLPGSGADVDPGKYHQVRHPKTADADGARDRIDGLLLQHADRLRKPVLGICYGLQSLNVHRAGTLLQHIESPVDHEAGSKVAVAHRVVLEPESKLAAIVAGPGRKKPESLPVNSSHHQSAGRIGDGLRIAARSEDDRIIEAVEGTAPDHFVLAVQWHPERSEESDEASRAIFRALIEAAKASPEAAAAREQVFLSPSSPSS